MLNYNHLYYFHVAATTTSIAAAADQLGITQATVSEQIRTLERSFGTPLFARQPTGLKLTDAGRVAFEHTSVMFGASERLLETLGRAAATLPHVLRVGMSATVARTTTTDFLMPLLSLDSCTPQVHCGDTIELVRELRGNSLDLVLCESDPPRQLRAGLESVVVDRTTLVAIAAPDVVPGDDWRGLGLVHYRASSSYRWDVESFLDAKGLHPRIVAEVDDALFLVEAAARGGFVTFAPHTVARDAIANHRVRVLATISPAHAGVHALYQAGDAAELARQAVEMLVARARANRPEPRTGR
jgi:DNA-binding transcriptional LysR family regulator